MSIPPKETIVAHPGQEAPQRHWWIALIPLVIAYVADLWSEEAVLENMAEGQRIPVLEPVLSWHFIRNPGAAFSIGTASDRKSTRLNSSHVSISYAVFCLKTKS